jgi:NADPH:quinone reductase
VCCYGAQSYRPFGTAAEFTVVPLDHVAPLPENVSPEQGACLGYQASRLTGPPMSGATSLDARCWCKEPGALWDMRVQLARHGGALVIGTVRSPWEEPTARTAGAHEVFLNDQTLLERMKTLAPEGLDHNYRSGVWS